MMHSGSPMFAGLNFKDVLYFKNGSSLAASRLGEDFNENYHRKAAVAS